MDGREAMAFSGGSAPYYIHRGGVGGSDPGAQSGGFQLQAHSGFRALSNARSGSAFSVEPQPQPQHVSFSPHGGGVSIGGGSSSLGTGTGDGGTGSGGGGGGGVTPSGVPGKKKRGRPRKYAPAADGQGQVSLRLSPMSAAAANSSPGSTTPSQKGRRGRPPGSGRKQQLAALGEWMNSSAGLAFSPHVITIAAGEDIVAKMLSFSQQRPRALCILSGSGTVSLVTLRQPASTSVGVTYEGRFEILCLSGSYLVAEDGGPHKRTGGMSVSLSSPEGHVIGGAVARLIAASSVQVVVCSFVYGNSKPKTTKQGSTTKDEDDSEPQSSDKLASPGSAAPPNQNYTASAAGIWPASRPLDLQSAHQQHTGIDLMRG